MLYNQEPQIQGEHLPELGLSGEHHLAALYELPYLERFQQEGGNVYEFGSAERVYAQLEDPSRSGVVVTTVVRAKELLNSGIELVVPVLPGAASFDQGLTAIASRVRAHTTAWPIAHYTGLVMIADNEHHWWLTRPAPGTGKGERLELAGGHQCPVQDNTRRDGAIRECFEETGIVVSTVDSELTYLRDVNYPHRPSYRNVELSTIYFTNGRSPEEIAAEVSLQANEVAGIARIHSDLVLAMLEGGQAGDYPELMWFPYQIKQQMAAVLRAMDAKK